MMFGFDPNKVDKTKETTIAATMNNSIMLRV
ncbi:BnaA05g18990D [Brassica napus]|uniref:BnaA05g18990D protein n=1 Tax=Brassica napus TaxID=3708 RepID=A0A078GJE7_BRANA|nr:BnaA05g19000D [Brassica napus]CDY25385.1 BnaA05g18990D [Brassica napus]